MREGGQPAARPGPSDPRSGMAAGRSGLAVVVLALMICMSCAGDSGGSGLDSILETVGADGSAVDYDVLRDPAEAFAYGDLIVAGYLMEIARGVTKIDSRVYPPWSEQEVKEALERNAATIARLKAEGAGAAVIAEFERSRERIIENRPRSSYSERHYAAFRVRVTEVFKGEIKVGDTVDVQIESGGLDEIDLLANQLRGTPRVIVGGTWWSPETEGLLLRGSDGATVDSLFASFPDLFWLDDGSWEPRDGDESEAAERPAPDPEALYLSGLDALAPGWGTLETLDDLAVVLRTASGDQISD